MKYLASLFVKAVHFKKKKKKKVELMELMDFALSLCVCIWKDWDKCSFRLWTWAVRAYKLLHEVTKQDF